MQFDYYYGAQSEQFSFIRIPRVMITEDTFSGLSLQAKMLYSVLLDRITLSRKNGWFDEENRVFIIYPITEIQSDLGFSRKKAMDYLSELEKFGLVEKKRRGLGLPSIIYVKSFMASEAARSTETGTTENTGDKSKNSGAQDNITRGSHIDITVVPESPHLEVPISTAPKNNTYMNNNNRSKNRSHLIVSYPGRDEMGSDEDQTQTMQAYEEIIRENIGYESLMITHKNDAELVNGILDLILETVMSTGRDILIASERYPAELVKNKFLKLDYRHIDYIIRCLKSNTTKVKNVKKYLLAALFNAPSTIDGYYRAEINHDMPELAK